MKYSPDVYHRHSIRLKEYDYSKEGMYFVTICTHNRECILGRIMDVGADSISAQIELNNVGKMINNIFLELEKQFNNIKLHDYIIMPNHIHAILEMCYRADMESAPTIGKIVQTFKRYTTIEYIKGVKECIYKPFDKKIWQRNYYEHIIRNEKEYYRIREYIINNVTNWKQDKYNEM